MARRAMKWVWRGFLGLVVAVVVIIAGGYLWLRSGLPDLDGTIVLDGLGASVRVVRDADAVPHIFAESDADAYFALGYVHAQDRLWQMEMQRRVGAGRLSEVIGEATLPVDRLMRTLGLYRLAEASLDALSPELRDALDSYTAGVNAWLGTHDGPLPPEFLLLRHRPEPWRPADSIVWGKLMALQLSANSSTEALRARLLRFLSPAQVDTLLPPGRGSTPTTLARAAQSGQIDPTLAALPALGPPTASNEWVVAGSRTATGAPILANDPHLQLAAPVLWYLARLETPTLSVAGAGVPGMPLTIIGHNARIAWGMTTTGGDVQDLFIERLDPADPSRYLTPGGSEPFLTRDETIAVKGGAPVTLRVRETRHGPVLSDVDEETAAAAGEGEVVALAWAGLGAGDTTAEAVWGLNRAGDWESFTAALRLWQTPQQNVVYADVEGRIGFYVPGLVPIRAGGDGRLPVPGWTGEYDWTGFIPFEALPQALDPPAGRIVNANNAVVGPGYPYLLVQELEEPYRAARIEEVLAGDDPHALDDSLRLQMDTLALDARLLLPLMLEVDAEGPSAAAVALLRGWDFRMDRGRPEPLLYAAWLRELNRVLYADELGPLFNDYWGFRPETVRRILADEPQWCDDVTTPTVPEDCPAALRASLRAALDLLGREHGEDMAAWRWGAAHRAPLAHAVLSRIPGLDRLFDLSIETDGGWYTVNRGASHVTSPAEPFAHVHGAGLRMVADLADLAGTRFMIATGQSGHPLSPHYGDLVTRWRDGGTLTLAGEPEPLGTLLLRPPER